MPGWLQAAAALLGVAFVSFGAWYRLHNESKDARSKAEILEAINGLRQDFEEKFQQLRKDFEEKFELKEVAAVNYQRFSESIRRLEAGR